MASRKPVKLPVSGLRSKARVFAPEAWDPGQVVREVLYSGVVWSAGPEQGRGVDSRWVVCEDGVVRVAVLSKEPASQGGGLSFLRWLPAQCDYVPSVLRPYSVDGDVVEPVEQPSIFDLALAA
jgi:hypothetical protein